MNFYELLLVIRQDVSVSEVEKIVDNIVEIIKTHGGSIHKKDFKGMVDMARLVKKNKKAQYYFLEISANKAALALIDKRVKLHDSILLSYVKRIESLTAVDLSDAENNEAVEIDPSASEKVIDVTANQNL